MKKQVYEIDEEGYLKEIHIAEFDEEGTPVEELPENFITIRPPNGMYRARWTNEEWVEDMSQAEIDELNKPTIPPLKVTELLSEEVEELKVSQSETDSRLLELMEIVLL